jgi:hypothetical protein
MFNELSIIILTQLEASDPTNMSRDHLDEYFYLDDGTFPGIKRYNYTYNQMVSNFIQDTKEMLRLDIPLYSPALRIHDSSIDQHSSFYYLYNVERYIWCKSWPQDIQLVKRLSRPNEFELKIQPGDVVIAVGDDENIHGLSTYLNAVTPRLVDELNHLRAERENVMRHFQNFTETINMIIRNISWNMGFKGKCRWERGFWSII